MWEKKKDDQKKKIEKAYISPFTIEVEYWGSWGYLSQFNRIKRSIQKEWSNIAVHGKAKPGGSGCLEVDIIGVIKDEEGKEKKIK